MFAPKAPTSDRDPSSRLAVDFAEELIQEELVQLKRALADEAAVRAAETTALRMEIEALRAAVRPPAAEARAP